MKECSILFSGAMVNAVLDGSKTQTRRMRGLEKVNAEPDRWAVEQQGLIDLPGAPYTGKRGVLFREEAGARLFVPARYATNTVLWVREAWRLPVTLDEFSGQDVDLRTTLAGRRAADLPIQYEADGAHRNWNGDFEPGRYRHGRFMPRWASRIDLQYISERVERLQNCSEADVIAEGIEGCEIIVNGRSEGRTWRDYGSKCDDPFEWFSSPIRSYQTLWKQINGAGSWEANPWVWVVEFRRPQHG